MENIENPQRDIGAEKMRRWEEEKKRVETATDKLGKKIDEGIRETVIALSVMGINVTASCEGHSDRATSAPYIDVEAQSAEALEEKIRKALSKEEAEKIVEQIEKDNLMESEKVIDLLQEFYQGRNVPYYRRIIIKPMARYWSRLESQGTALQEIKPQDIKKQRLAEFQQEMKDFTEFLKNKFFSE